MPKKIQLTVIDVRIETKDNRHLYWEQLELHQAVLPKCPSNDLKKMSKWYDEQVIAWHALVGPANTTKIRWNYPPNEGACDPMGQGHYIQVGPWTKNGKEL